MATTAAPIGFTTAEVTAQFAQMSPPQRWRVACEVFAQTEDVLQGLEGKTKASFVIAANEGEKDQGQIINIRVRSGFYGEGRKGTEHFTDDSHFEKRKGSSYKVYFGPHRHASSYQGGVAVQQGIESDLENGTVEEMGRWAGRKRCEEGLMTIRERCPSVNRIWANGKSLHELKTEDIWDRDNAVIAAGFMKRMGGGLANAGKLIDGQVMQRVLALPPTSALTRLKLDGDYKASLASAQARGAGNPLFTGDIVDLDNVVQREVLGLQHDGDGPIGSVLEPMGLLGTAIAAGTAVFNVTFGDVTSGVNYCKWFPGYNYTFTEGDTLAVPVDTGASDFPAWIHGAANTTDAVASGGEHYLMIINPPTTGGAGEVANAIGYYAYTIGNDGNKITITARLGSATGGQAVGTALGSHYRGRVTTLGSIANTAACGTVANGGVAGTVTVPGSANSVVWGAGTWGGRTLTDAHPVGSLVLPCNVRGVPFGWVPVLGGGALLRAKGRVQNLREQEKFEGSFGTKVFLRDDFGHRLRINRRGYCPSLALVGVALSDPSLPIPIVT